MPASPPGGDARESVSKREERSPALVLPHVDPFVGSGGFEHGSVDREDRVAEGDGRRAATGRQTAEKPSEDAAMKLDHACSHLGPASARQDEGSEAEGHERPRPGPQVTGDFDGVFHQGWLLALFDDLMTARMASVHASALSAGTKDQASLELPDPALILTRSASRWTW